MSKKSRNGSSPLGVNFQPKSHSAHEIISRPCVITFLPTAIRESAPALTLPHTYHDNDHSRLCEFCRLVVLSACAGSAPRQTLEATPSTVISLLCLPILCPPPITEMLHGVCQRLRAVI